MKKLRSSWDNICTGSFGFFCLSTDVTVRKLQYRVGTVIRVSTQRRHHNFIVLLPYFYIYTCSRCSSPFPDKALALRTDSDGLSDPMNDERSVGIEQVQERRRAKFSSSWSDRILLNFGVFASTENYIPACTAESVKNPFALWHDVEIWYLVFAVRNICFGQMAGISIRYQRPRHSDHWSSNVWLAHSLRLRLTTLYRQACVPPHNLPTCGKDRIHKQALMH